MADTGMAAFGIPQTKADIEVLGDYSSQMGGGQAVIHDSSAKVNYGASSPRKDGAAVPEPPRYFDPPAAKKKNIRN